MDISPQDSLLSKDVFHVIADNFKMFLPLNLPVKYPSIASPAVDQTNELIEEYWNNFMACTNLLREIASKDPFNSFYFGDMITSFFSNLDCSSEKMEILWHICCSLWKVAIRLTSSKGDGCFFVDWLRCMVAISQTEDTLLCLAKELQNENDDWSFNDVYELIEFILNVNDEVIDLFFLNESQMFDIMHHHTLKIQLLAHSLTSFCFTNYCAEYTSYLSTDDLIAFFKDHSLVISSQIYPFRSSHSLLLTSIYGSPSLKIPKPSSLQNQPIPADVVYSASVRPASRPSGNRVDFALPPQSYVVDPAVDASALPAQPVFSASAMAVAPPAIPPIPLAKAIASPIPPSPTYQVATPVPPSMAPFGSAVPVGSPVPPSPVPPSMAPFGSPVPPSALLPTAVPISSPVPSSVVPIHSPVPPSVVPISSPVPPSSTALDPANYSLRPAKSCLFTSMPASFDSSSLNLPLRSCTVRPSSSASDRPSSIARPMSASSSLVRQRSYSIPQMDISTGKVIPESISIPITALTPKTSPKPQVERKGIEDYLAFPPGIQLDVKALDSKFDSKNQSQISRSDFVSFVVSTDPMKSSILSSFARDVYDTLAVWKEETVSTSLLFGILSLFENSSFSDRCEVLLFVSLQCRIVFAFRSTIRKSSKPTNSRVFLTPFSKFSPSSFALFPR